MNKTLNNIIDKLNNTSMDVNQDLAIPYEDILKQAENLTVDSSMEQVTEVIITMFFSNINGIKRGNLIQTISQRTGIGKHDLKQELKKIKEQYAVNPADPAMEVVEVFLKDYCKDGDHIRLGTDSRFWIYLKTHWEPYSDLDIWSQIVAFTEKLHGQSKTNLKKIATDAKELLKAKTCNQHGLFDPFKGLHPVINCLNGELWLEADGTFNLKPHDPDSGLTYCLSVEFDPKATCPEFDSALEGIFQNAEDSSGMTRHFMEVIGYALQPERDIPVYTVFFGAGRNGKTRLAFTLLSLIGEGGFYVDHIDKLDASRFVIAHLAGKRVFLDDDVKAGTKLPDGLLKTMSESKKMSGEFKFKDRFIFECRVYPFLLCNNYPSLVDLSVGMQRRAMVIPFAKTFTEEECDTELFDRIEKNELAGVLNKALEGLKRLRQRGSFEYPVDVIEANKDWFAQCSSLAAFIRHQCKHSADAKSKVSELYNSYQHWTESQGFKQVTPRYKMKSELKALGYTVKDVGGYPWVYGLQYHPENMLKIVTGSEPAGEQCSGL